MSESHSRKKQHNSLLDNWCNMFKDFSTPSRYLTYLQQQLTKAKFNSNAFTCRGHHFMLYVTIS